MQLNVLYMNINPFSPVIHPLPMLLWFLRTTDSTPHKKNRGKQRLC